MQRGARANGQERGLRRAAAAGLVPALVAWVACAGEGAPRGEPPSFDHVLLISIDTLRADFLGCYGHPYVRSPHIDRLAREGLLFEQHISVTPETLPSHTSLMTGTYPRTHGAPRNRYEVSDHNIMLAELLSAYSFETAAFVAAMPLTHLVNFDQGFAYFDEPTRAVRRHDARAVTDATLAWLAAEERERTFVFVHYFDVHAPYKNGEPYDSMYLDQPAASLPTLGEVARELRKGSSEARAQSLAWKARYGGGVTYVDEQIGRLVQVLRRRGLLDRTLVLVTSDHGESMDAHPLEYWDHGHTVFDETVHTPLVLRFPHGWRGGTRIAHLVANIDVVPTLLDLLKLPVPQRVEGRSFVPLLRGGGDPVRDDVFVEATKPTHEAFEKGTTWPNERKMRGVRSERWKLVHQPAVDRVGLYDLRADPDEQSDLARDAPEPAPLDEMRRRLDAWSSGEASPAVPAALEAWVSEQLRALGYAE